MHIQTTTSCHHAKKFTKMAQRKDKHGVASFSYIPSVPLALDEFVANSESRAVLSHWLQNLGTKAARPYQKRALAMLPRWAQELPPKEFIVAESSLPVSKVSPMRSSQMPTGIKPTSSLETQ